MSNANNFMYSRRGFVFFVIVVSFLWAIFMVVVTSKAETTLVESVSIFLWNYLFAVPIGVFVYALEFSIHKVLYRPVKPKSTKASGSSRNKTVLESQKQGLTEIHLGEIHNILALTRIDFGINEIHHIDLTPLAGSLKLTELILYYNRLEEINLSPLAGCTNLEYIDLAVNNLRTIDLTPLKSCKKIDAVNLGGNETGQIDLTPLSALSNLKILTIDGMKLKEVDLSPLENCKQLEFLKLNDNEMKTVDITPLFECKSLDNLEIDGIQLLTTLDNPIEDWPKGIQKHKRKIRKIDAFV